MPPKICGEPYAILFPQAVLHTSVISTSLVPRGMLRAGGCSGTSAGHGVFLTARSCHSGGAKEAGPLQESAYPNKDALSKALDVYLDAMRGFVVRRLRRIPGRRVDDAITEALNDRRREEFTRSLGRGESIEGSIEIRDLPHLVSKHWRDAFGPSLDFDSMARNRIWLTVEARNRAAHRGEGDIDIDYVQTRLYDAAMLLDLIKASDAAGEVRTIRDEIVAAAPPTRRALRSAPAGNGNGIRTRVVSRLKPWRDAAPPNGDVTDGTFRQAEFAADLQSVFDGRAADEYGNPVSFLARTHITPGMRKLLATALSRFAGEGGDPVIQTRTGFGGGKTHSLIALYHLATQTPALTADNEEIRGLVEEVGLDPSERVAQVAVLDCTHLTPTDEAVTAEGAPLNTLWGVMADQLGAYDTVARSAREGSAPGGAQLDALLEQAGPCVILIDELVAYVRNRGVDLDSICTFVQNLTHAVRRSPRAVLVVTLPESDAEAGGERGAEALRRLDAILGRIQASWEPLEVHEAFEVVRRRLFGDDVDTVARDETCEAFSRMYARAPRDYPMGVVEQRYVARMKDCYPLHPEIFDRLYEDWSSITRFQRTRGVLRMMANAISRLYRDGDASPLIMPGDLPFSDPALSSEFADLLDGRWEPVFSEADSEGSRTDLLDAANQRFGDVGGAARRIARTILLGSAPAGAVRGIDERSIRLGVVQPGHGVAGYQEALRQMSGGLYYLYESGGRYWFHAEENLNKVAADRAVGFGAAELDARIAEELREAARRTGVIVCPSSSADVPDDGSVRLVVLPPSQALPSRSSENNDAEDAVLEMLTSRGDARRTHRNTLVFLAARNDDVRTVRTAVRQHIAWASIVDGARRVQDLEGERAAQARASLQRSRAEVAAALVRAWSWALTPSQPDPRTGEYRLAEYQTAASGEIVQDALKRLAAEEALVHAIAPSQLANLLRQYIWDSTGERRDHIGVSALRDTLTANVYLPRIANAEVLVRCIREGVTAGDFGFATGHDPQSAGGAGYAGLRFRQSLVGVPGDAIFDGLLVEHEMAELAKGEAEEADRDAEDDGGEQAAASGSGGPGTTDAASSGGTAVQRPTHLVATAVMSEDISVASVDQLRKEIIRNLREDDADIEVEITIRAEKRVGFSEHTERALNANAHHLGVHVDFKGGSA